MLLAKTRPAHRVTLLNTGVLNVHTPILHFEIGAVCFHFVNVRNSSTWGQQLQDKDSSSFFRSGTLPPSVYLGRQNVIPVIKWIRSSPSVFVYASDQKLDGGKPWE